MAFCSRCGVSLQSRFCAACGNPGNGEEAFPLRLACLLCYAFGFISGGVFLALPPVNAHPLIRFHSLQSIFISLAALVLITFSRVLVPGWLPVVGIASLSLWIFVMLKTYQGAKIVLPLAGPAAEQMASRRTS